MTTLYTSKNVYDYSKTNQYHQLIIALDNKNNDDDWYRDELGFTAINVAAKDYYSDCVRILISHGADVNSKSDTGLTALNWFVYKGDIEMVKLLISNGAEINPRELTGASYFGRKEIVQLLLSMDCDILGDIDRYSPRDDNADMDCRPMIIAAIEHRLEVKKKSSFDTFTSHYINYPLYITRLNSICFPTGDPNILIPAVGWEAATALRNKFYFDEIFFYLHLNVAKVYTNKNKQITDEETHFSNIAEFANVNNDTSTLMTVLSDYLKMYLNPDKL